MDSKIKPMLATAITDKDLTDKVVYPVLTQPKYDGIRAWLERGVMLSRTGKPIRNIALQKAVMYLQRQPDFETLDGELMPLEDPFGPRAFARATEIAMSTDGDAAQLCFHVFDVVDHLRTTTQRLERARVMVDTLRDAIAPLRIVVAPTVECEDYSAVITQETLLLAKGAEGVMLRQPKALYKFGRSNKTDQALLKLKRFQDDEVEIIGYWEEVSNQNEKIDKVTGGHKRSTHAENLVGKGTLGSLTCRNEKLWPGVTFNVGSGWTAAERVDLWARRDTLPGQYLKIKHQPSGAQERPRFPVALGLRDKGDM